MSRSLNCKDRELLRKLEQRVAALEGSNRSREECSTATITAHVAGQPVKIPRDLLPGDEVVCNRGHRVIVRSYDHVGELLTTNTPDNMNTWRPSGRNWGEPQSRWITCIKRVTSKPVEPVKVDKDAEYLRQITPELARQIVALALADVAHPLNEHERRIAALEQHTHIGCLADDSSADGQWQTGLPMMKPETIERLAPVAADQPALNEQTKAALEAGCADSLAGRVTPTDFSRYADQPAGDDAVRLPCGICDEPVLRGLHGSFAEYHDCKPVPGAKLDKALADLAAMTERAEAEYRGRQESDDMVHDYSKRLYEVLAERDAARAEADALRALLREALDYEGAEGFNPGFRQRGHDAMK